MSSSACFALAGIGLFLVGLRALIRCPHLLRKVFGVNLMGSGTFLLLVAPAPAGDPVTQAMVITGIVVAVSASALALNLMLKVAHATGAASLDPPPPCTESPGPDSQGQDSQGQKGSPERAAPSRSEAD